MVQTVLALNDAGDGGGFGSEGTGDRADTIVVEIVSPDVV
jgi:hypothetical protein